MGKYYNLISLLRYNNHINHVNNSDNFFKCFRCPSCDTCFKMSHHTNRHVICCRDRVKNIGPKIVYTLPENLSEKKTGCVQFWVYQRTNLIQKFRYFCLWKKSLSRQKHELGSQSKPIFWFGEYPESLIIEFLINLELLAAKIKLKCGQNFFKLKITSKSTTYEFQCSQKTR